MLVEYGSVRTIGPRPAGTRNPGESRRHGGRRPPVSTGGNDAAAAVAAALLCVLVGPLSKAGDELVVGSDGAGFLLGAEVGNKFVDLVFDFSIRFFAHAVKEHHAIEMVVFVLQNPREKIVDVSFDWISGQIECAEPDRLWPLHLAVDTWQTETPFAHRLGALGQLQLGIDQHHLFAIATSATGIDDEHTYRQIDLVGGKADAFVLIHQIKHLCREIAELLVDSTNGLALEPQRWMRIRNDAEVHRNDVICVGPVDVFG